MTENKDNERKKKMQKNLQLFFGSTENEKFVCIRNRVVEVKTSFDVCVTSNSFNATVLLKIFSPVQSRTKRVYCQQLLKKFHFKNKN